MKAALFIFGLLVLSGAPLHEDWPRFIAQSLIGLGALGALWVTGWFRGRA